MKKHCPDCGIPIVPWASRCRMHSVVRRYYSQSLACLFVFSCSVIASLAAGIFVYWTNGDNPTATTNIVQFGVSSGVYTGFVSVPFGQTNVAISNLVAGQRYYGVVVVTDGVDVSFPSNEANAKTKLNPNKGFSAVAQ